MHFPEELVDQELRLGLRRQRAARQEVPRAAHRQLAGAHRRLARRAHADRRPRRIPQGETHYVAARLPVRLRQDQSRDADSAGLACRAGRSGRSATTSPGCTRARTGACGRSIPKPATSAWCRARTRRPTATRYDMIRRDTLFTNVALTADNQPWWEGLPPASRCIDWQGRPYDPAQRPGRAPELALHRVGEAQSRATRRTPRMPAGRADLARSCSAAGAAKSRRWCTRRATGSTACWSAPRWPRRPPPPPSAQVGVVRRDPMAMQPFCGYNFGDYWRTG